MSLARIEDTGAPVAIDQDAIMKYLNLNPRDPASQALILTCDRYGLDPLLKHLVLISGRPYITRDGYLHVAHASGQFDGMEVIEQGETAAEWWAKVSVYRKDMRHPFTYIGRFSKSEAKHMAKYGPEMAMKCAEVMALRRAFSVSGMGAAEELHTETPYLVPPGAAKTQLLDACGGDRDRALELWGDRGSEPIPEVELDQLLDLAEAVESDTPRVAEPDPASGAGDVAAFPPAGAENRGSAPAENAKPMTAPTRRKLFALVGERWPKGDGEDSDTYDERTRNALLTMAAELNGGVTVESRKDITGPLAAALIDRLTAEVAA